MVQVAWSDEDGVHDEDVIRPPRAMSKYTAAVQYNILTEDGCAGVNPQVGLRPSASLYGATTIWDSHGVNKVIAKHLRSVMDPCDLVLFAYCLQHLTGNTATAITKHLNIFTRVWTLCKTLSEGDFFLDLRKRCYVQLDDPDEGLEVADPECCILDPDD